MKNILKVIGIVCLTILCIVTVCIIHRKMITKEGVVGIEQVIIEDISYHYEGFTLSGEGKTIALVDEWEINEVPEDPAHNFLVVRSFLDQYYIVRDGYVIPTEGNVSCAYIGHPHERTQDADVLNALTEILQNEYSNGIDFVISDKKEAMEGLEHVTVGYEECPVGTDDSIYYIGKYNSQWIIVFREDLGEWNQGQLPAKYYALENKYGEIFEDSGLWE